MEVLTLRSTSFPSKSYNPAPFDVISEASLLASFSSLICQQKAKVGHLP